MTFKASMSFGLNVYQDYPDARLSGCVQDSMDMRRLFQEGLGFTEDQCAVLWDGDCTKKGMLHGLGLLTQNADRLNVALWSSSGHGTTYPNTSEMDSWEGALVCHDLKEYADGSYDPSTLLLEDEIDAALSVIPNTCLFEAFLDACYVGEFADQIIPMRIIKNSFKVRSLQPRIKVIRPLCHRVMQARHGENTVIWAASQPDQTSAEEWISGKSRGAFTYYFCREFAPDMPRGVLLEKVAQALKTNGYSQVPMLECSDRLRELPVGVK